MEAPSNVVDLADAKAEKQAAAAEQAAAEQAAADAAAKTALVVALRLRLDSEVGWVETTAKMCLLDGDKLVGASVDDVLAAMRPAVAEMIAKWSTVRQGVPPFSPLT
jgi:hypothetical protein